MYSSFMQMMTTWKTRTSDRQKLQHTYAVAAIVLFVLAGVLGLFNYGLGQVILMGAGIAAGLFVTNAVVWALVQSFVLLRISTLETPKTNKK